MYYKKLKIYLLIPIITLFASTVYSDWEPYHPKIPIKLGHSFDSDFPGDVKRNALIIKDRILLSDGISVAPPSESLNFDMKVVDSSSELLKYMGISASLEAKYAAYKGKASFSFQEDFEFHERSIVWCLYAKSSYPGEFLKTEEPNISLTNDAKKMLSSQSLASEPDYYKFKKIYGTKYISGIKRGNRIYVLVNITNVSDEHKKLIKGAVEGSWKGGPNKLSFKTQMSKYIEEARKRESLKISVETTGGFAADLADLVNVNIADFDKLREIMKKYFKDNFKYDRAVPVAYTTSSLIALAGKIDPFEEKMPEKDMALVSLYDKKQKVLNQIKKLNQIETFKKAYNYNHNLLVNKKEIRKKLRTHLENITKIQKSCLMYFPKQGFDLSKCEYDKEIEDFKSPPVVNPINTGIAIKRVEGSSLMLENLQLNFNIPLTYSMASLQIKDSDGNRISSINLNSNELSNTLTFNKKIKIADIPDGLHPFERLGLDYARTPDYYSESNSRCIEKPICCRMSPYWNDLKCRAFYDGQVQAHRQMKNEAIEKPKLLEIYLTEEYEGINFPVKIVQIQSR